MAERGVLPILLPEYRSCQMFDPLESVPGLFYYDVEGEADNAVYDFLQTRDRERGEESRMG